MVPAVGGGLVHPVEITRLVRAYVSACAEQGGRDGTGEARARLLALETVRFLIDQLEHGLRESDSLDGATLDPAVVSLSALKEVVAAKGNFEVILQKAKRDVAMLFSSAERLLERDPALSDLPALDAAIHALRDVHYLLGELRGLKLERSFVVGRGVDDQASWLEYRAQQRVADIKAADAIATALKRPPRLVENVFADLLTKNPDDPYLEGMIELHHPAEIEALARRHVSEAADRKMTINKMDSWLVSMGGAVRGTGVIWRRVLDTLRSEVGAMEQA